MKKKSAKRSYSDEEKRDLLRAFRAHSGPKVAFFQRRKVSGPVIYRWLRESKQQRKKAPARKPAAPVTRKKSGPYAPERRRQAVEAYLKSGMTVKEFGKVWGVGSKTLPLWVKAYQEKGPAALENDSFGKGGKRGPKGIAAPVKDEIIEVKKSNPSFGLKKVRDFLMRFRGVKVSTGTIRKTVVEAQLPSPPPPENKPKRAPAAIRFFERAQPMQLWQSDITSFVLTRHSTRVYLTVFMDDNSRYVVSWALMLRQTNDLVMDTLLSGIQRFGKPEEVLTDQGRQYFSWRGRSDFQKLLDREGIRHVVSRSHHPETLGKCERFWETVGREFWDRVKPQELNDTRERLENFIAHYNHFRPHQGIGGLVPADKFFGLESEIRRTIEETVDRNALRLALGEMPRSPVFLIGQIGNQPLSLHGESGKLVIQTPNGAIQRLDYETFGHVTKQSNLNQGESNGEESGRHGGINDEKPGNSEAGAEEGLSSTAATCGAGAGPVGLGDARAEGESAPISGGSDGVLDGTSEQAGRSDQIVRAATPSLAAVAAGDFRYGGGVTHPTENTSQGSASDEPGRRSEEVAEEDSGTREAHRDAGSIDRGAPRDAGMSGCQHPDGGTAADPASNEEGTSGECSKNGQERQDDGTGGRSG
jgi:transposase InsO family protein/transposase-like protein